MSIDIKLSMVKIEVLIILHRTSFDQQLTILKIILNQKLASSYKIVSKKK